jgi:hypothetical protein
MLSYCGAQFDEEQDGQIDFLKFKRIVKAQMDFEIEKVVKVTRLVQVEIYYYCTVYETGSLVHGHPPPFPQSTPRPYSRIQTHHLPPLFILKQHTAMNAIKKLIQHIEEHCAHKTGGEDAGGGGSSDNWSSEQLLRALFDEWDVDKVGV